MRSPRAAVTAIFFVSGASGLIYEVAWSRTLRLLVGSTTLAHTIVLSAFMAGLALGAWGVEWHERATFESTWGAPPDGSAFEIPLRCLISENTPNLLFAAGRTADGDQKAGASLRVMGTAFATGQAAGAAAAMLADGGSVVPDTLRERLRAQGALVDLEALRAMPVIA